LSRQLGSYHTLEVELDRPARITKDSWDVLSLQFLEQSCSDSGKYDVAAVILQEGLAHVCSVAGAGSIRVLAKIEANFPKKRIGSAYEKATDSFYVHVMNAMLERFEFAALKAIVLASPALFRVFRFKGVSNDTESF
jgi:protein pelota